MRLTFQAWKSSCEKRSRASRYAFSGRNACGIERHRLRGAMLEAPARPGRQVDEEEVSLVRQAAEESRGFVDESLEVPDEARRVLVAAAPERERVRHAAHGELERAVRPALEGRVHELVVVGGAKDAAASPGARSRLSSRAGARSAAPAARPSARPRRRRGSRRCRSRARSRDARSERSARGRRRDRRSREDPEIRISLKVKRRASGSLPPSPTAMGPARSSLSQKNLLRAARTRGRGTSPASRREGRDRASSRPSGRPPS